VKNNYLLPLITELIDSMGSKKVFTKMDLRWGFNNVWIKEGNEWKGAFMTHVGCKGTPNPRLRSPFQSSGAIL